MAYTESREKSAECLRTALGFMREHDAAFNPITYTVWYEYSAGVNARLNEALERLKETDPRLGDASIQKLYREHIATVDEATMERISQDFARVMNGVAETASTTGERAGALGSRLDELSLALRESDVDELQSQLQEALRHTRTMRASTAELQAQVSQSQGEIDRLKEDLDRAREAAFVDSLTMVLNRNGLDHYLAELVKTPPELGRAHCLILLDVDHFKVINEQHGHLMGDRVLATVGKVLRASVDAPEQKAARSGGEEFAVLLPHSSLQEALELAERVRTRTKGMKLRNRHTNEVILTVTVSAGVTALQRGESPEDWLTRTTWALHRAKEGGRDRVDVDSGKAAA